MRKADYFSDVIINVEFEEVKSEIQRSYLLIFLFSLIFIIALTNFFLFKESLVDFYGGTNTFITVVLFMVLFLLYQSFVLRYLKQVLGRRLKASLGFKILHTMIETSFPSAIAFYMMFEMNMVSFIDSPVTLIYFLFIILSILHLDYRVSLFAGAFAALEYNVLIYYGFNYVEAPAVYLPSTPENSHYIRGILLVFSGGAAGFVANDLKRRIKNMFDYLKAKNELELLFGQQVSKEVSKALIEEKGITKRLEATVMFLDIRNFTSFADAHTPDEVVDYQNKFLGPVIDIINQHQGVVFQILGDGLMACFGTPVENVLHADMAFQASLRILEKIREASDNQTIPPTMVGIGLHCGTIVAGNIGNEQRKQFSISGSPVIIASRIEQLNKKYLSQFLISGQVYNRISPGKIRISFIGEEPLRGIGKPVEVYKIHFAAGETLHREGN